MLRVAIAGAGVVGSAVAYYLARKGVEVTVIERCGVACAASGKSGGFLARDWCRGQAQDALARASFDLHADLAHELGADYGYRRIDTYGAAVSGRRAPGGSAPLSALAWLNGDCVVQQRLGDATDTALVEPAQFTRALLEGACRGGARLHIGCVEGVVTTRTGARIAGVAVDGEVLAAEALVIAMGPWSLHAAQWLRLPPVFGLKGFSITLRPPAPPPPVALFLDYEDEGGERHGPELMVRADGEVYLCGFTDDAPLPPAPQDVRAQPAACTRLHALAGRLASTLAALPVEQRRACYRPVCEDAMPLLGAIPGVAGAYVATGHNCWGMLNAPGSGLALAELIADGRARAIDLTPFDPARLAPARSASPRP